MGVNDDEDFLKSKEIQSQHREDKKNTTTTNKKQEKVKQMVLTTIIRNTTLSRLLKIRKHLSKSLKTSMASLATDVVDVAVLMVRRFVGSFVVWRRGGVGIMKSNVLLQPLFILESEKKNISPGKNLFCCGFEKER